MVEFLHFDIQSTGQKSHCVNIVPDLRNALFHSKVGFPLSAPVLSWLFIALGKARRTDVLWTSTGSPRSPFDRSAQSAVGRTFRRSETPRPNPQSQSLSRGYGSILPTSLTYILLSARGCTPGRPEAVMSTTRVRISRHRIFKGRRDAPDNSRLSCFPSRRTLSPTKSIPGCARLLTRKDSSRRRLRLCLCCHSVSTSWCGNINPLPFR